MCGFVLLLGRERAIEAQIMLDNMLHRGTEHPIIESSANFIMGHIRLPINGLSRAYDQPYVHKGWMFGFVGEIVNFKEIIPAALSDVEVLAHLWMDRKESCVRAFDGFWSIAAVSPWGSFGATIVTDFLDKKPVYYRQDLQAFASEIRPLAKLAPVTADPLYFSSVRKWGYHIGRRTWAKEIIKLPAGSLTIMNSIGEVNIHEGFDTVEPNPEIDLIEAILQSVRRRVLAADVPIALLLSGGLDSSIIYKLARGLRSDLTVYHTFNDGDCLEHLGVTEPTCVISLDESIPIDDVLRANEGPVDLGSVLPQLSLAKGIKERVALSGDGADELFGGYRRSLEYDSQSSDIFEEIVHYHAPRLDKLMMSNTIELRCPFMGRDVLAGALALPWQQRQDKIWLREAFKDILPTKITYGKKVPLKSEAVINGGIKRRHMLCDIFEDMIEKGDF